MGSGMGDSGKGPVIPKKKKQAAHTSSTLETSLADCIRVHWKNPEKSRPSSFIFQKHTSGQSGQTQRLTAVPDLVNPLYHTKKKKKKFCHFLWRVSRAFVNKNPLCMFLSWKSIAVGQLDLNDRSLSKIWMNPVNWNSLTWEKIGMPILSVYLESGWPGNSVDTLFLCQFQTHLSLDTWIFIPRAS